MHFTYTLLVVVVLSISLIIDIAYAKVSAHHPLKLFIAVIFIFGIFFFLDYAGVLLKLWAYSGEGILGIYFLDMPIEEYFFIVVTPYGAIVLWEALHKLIKTKRK